MCSFACSSLGRMSANICTQYAASWTCPLSKCAGDWRTDNSYVFAESYLSSLINKDRVSAKVLPQPNILMIYLRHNSSCSTGSCTSGHFSYFCVSPPSSQPLFKILQVTSSIYKARIPLWTSRCGPLWLYNEYRIRRHLVRSQFYAKCRFPMGSFHQTKVCVIAPLTVPTCPLHYALRPLVFCALSNIQSHHS